MSLKPLNRKSIPVGLFAILLILDVSALVCEKMATMASVKDVHKFCFAKFLNPTMSSLRNETAGNHPAIWRGGGMCPSPPKVGSDEVRIFSGGATGLPVGHLHALFYLSLIRQPWLWLGLAIGPFQLWVWTGILGRTDLSVAYPIASLSYPLTMVVAQLAFGEQLGWQVWLGAVFITIGVAVTGSAGGHHRDALLAQTRGAPGLPGGVGYCIHASEARGS